MPFAGNRATESKRVLGAVTSRGWAIWALMLALAVYVTGLAWAFSSRDGVAWDEAHYSVRLMDDLHAYHTGGSESLFSKWRWEERIRPPAYRIVFFPIVWATDAEAPWVRVASAGVFLVTLALLWLTARRVTARPEAGWLTVGLLLLCPRVMQGVFTINTEFGVYLGAALVFATLAYAWNQPDRRWQWVLGGVAGGGLALGVMSKLSFVPMAAVMLACIAGLAVMRAAHTRLQRTSATRLAKAVSIADGAPGWAYFTMMSVSLAALSLPWYWAGWGPATRYATYAASFDRHSLDGPWWAYAWMFAISVLGLVVTGVVIIAVAWAGVRWLRGSPDASLRSASACEKHTGRGGLAAVVFTALASAGAVVALHAMGLNQNPRLVGPAVPALVLSLGIVTAQLGLTRARWMLAVLVAGSSLQLGVMMLPEARRQSLAEHAPLVEPVTEMFIYYEPWDFAQVATLARTHGYDAPRLAYLGNSAWLNGPQIEIAFRRAGMFIKVQQLTRYEQGPAQIDAMVEQARDFDVVMTAPSLMGEPLNLEPIDNAYNREFADKFGTLPEFDRYELGVGPGDQANILVFLRQPALARHDIAHHLPALATQP